MEAQIVGLYQKDLETGLSDDDLFIGFYMDQPGVQRKRIL